VSSHNGSADFSNAFPHTTFNWVGLDGTEILTHMTPVGNYDSRCSLEDINRAHTHHLSLDTTPSALLLYGDGDGGGGPKAYMIENLRRLKAIAETHGEIPAVRLGGKMRDFFQQVRKETDGGKTLASWVGELYLEFHRGVCRTDRYSAKLQTYTSQASTKRGNRKGEILLREVELFATLASIAGSTYRFPKKVGL
jgi:alpha-mannosidase